MIDPNVSNQKMMISKTTSLYEPSLEYQIISWLVIICGIAVINIWAIAHTIGARNIFLAIGALGSILLLFYRKPNMLSAQFYCPYFLLAVIAWLWFHYLINEVSPDRSYRELTSTWIRVFFSILLGIGVGSICSESKKMSVIITLSLFFLLGLHLLIYLIHLFKLGYIPSTSFKGLFSSKAAGTYFLMWPLLLTCAFIDFNSLEGLKTQTTKSMVQFFLYFLIILFCFLAFYSLASLNGLIISTVMLLILIIRNLYKSFIKKKFFTWNFFLAIISITLVTIAIADYSKNNNKLGKLITDIEIGAQIDLYPNWRNYSDLPWVPTVPDGHQVNQSTYYRTANALEGIRIINANPLGAGFTYLAYGFYLSKMYPGSQSDHTHSGWIDLTLGIGIPGLLLCLAAIFLAIKLNLSQLKRAPKSEYQKLQWQHITIWSLGGITLLWAILEVSEKEYIEHFFFMISVLSVGSCSASNQTKKI